MSQLISSQEKLCPTLSKHKLGSLSPERLFLWGLACLVGLTVIQLPFDNGHAFFSLLHSDPDDTFMDFFNSIYDAQHGNPYLERGVIYPPLTYVYYKLWGLLLPPWGEMETKAKAVSESMRGEVFWRNSQSGIIVAFLMTILTVLLLHRVLMQALSETGRSRKTVWWVLLGSVPFWFAYERGNLALQTLLFLAYFVNNYRSENKIKRELALISLSVAVAFKIYPVVFGVLLLLDKKYKEAARCVLYGVLLFFLPFLLFGRLKSFPIMLSNIMSTTQMMTQKGFGYKVNIDNTLAFLMEPFQAQPSAAVSLTVKLLLAACMVFVLLFTRKDWQRYMVLSAVMMVFPGFSYAYTLVFAAIPLLAFLAGKPKATAVNMLFSLLFLCMFAPFPLGGEALYDTAPKISADFMYPLNLTTILESLSLPGMLFLMTFDVVRVGFFPQTEHTSRHEALCFAVILLLLTAVLSGGYLLCDRLYDDAFLLTEEGRQLLKEQEMAAEISDTISAYVEEEDSVVYFSHTPLLDSAPIEKQAEVQWVELSQASDMQNVKTVRKVLPTLERTPPKVFIYCTYPKPVLEEVNEVSEAFEQTYTAEDHLNEFVFENRYTLRGSYSISEEYRVLVYINLQD